MQFRKQCFKNKVFPVVRLVPDWGRPFAFSGNSIKSKKTEYGIIAGYTKGSGYGKSTNCGCIGKTY